MHLGLLILSLFMYLIYIIYVYTLVFVAWIVLEVMGSSMDESSLIGGSLG